MAEDKGWLKETIFEMKDDIKALAASFNKFMQERRLTCPTAVEIEKADEKRKADEDAKNKAKVLKWSIVGVISAVVLGLPGWIALLK